MVRMGPGDYLVASPTFPLMLKKVLPIFLRLFDRLMQLGNFVHSKNIFLFSEEGCRRLWGHVPEDPPRVLFGHAGGPDSLESATIKAAWLDECGQNGFRLASYEAILGRLSIHQGRVLLTSRPYTLGWMKQLLWDPGQAPVPWRSRFRWPKWATAVGTEREFNPHAVPAGPGVLADDSVRLLRPPGSAQPDRHRGADCLHAVGVGRALSGPRNGQAVRRHHARIQRAAPGGTLPAWRLSGREEFCGIPYQCVIT